MTKQVTQKRYNYSGRVTWGDHHVRKCLLPIEWEGKNNIKKTIYENYVDLLGRRRFSNTSDSRPFMVSRSRVCNSPSATNETMLPKN